MKKIFSLKVGLLILLASILVNCAAATPVQYSGNGHFYDVISVPGGITWGDAKTEAAQYSGHLATITSQDENDFITTKFDTDWHWLGGFQQEGSAEPNGGWQWITNEPWVYTNWHQETNEPNNQGGNENVLQFWGTSGQWNDQEYGDLSTPGYVIEYETPADVVRQMIVTIGDLVASGELDSVPGKASIAVLNDVIRALNAGNTKTATAQLKTFINQIKSYINGGLISSTEGQELIDSANTVINAIA